MRKLGFINSLIFFANSIAAFFLLLSFVLPYLPPSKFPLMSILSLGVSPLILVNVVFLIYWLIKLKKQLLLSLIVLALSALNFSSFIKFNISSKQTIDPESIRIASYNVRVFNRYQHKALFEETPKFMREFVDQYKPEILLIQEYYKRDGIDLEEKYPYNYIIYSNKHRRFGHAIFSNYPILASGNLDFKKTSNNGIWADFLIGQDTLRTYNVHLQSYGVSASIDYLQDTDKEEITKKLSDTFVEQEDQVKEIRAHMKQSTKTPYYILTGDANNTPFSYTYKHLRGDMKDAFLEKGSGLGTTFSFDGYPLRIDYIFTSQAIDVEYFEVGKETFSDHKPLIAEILLK